MVVLVTALFSIDSNFSDSSGDGRFLLQHPVLFMGLLSTVLLLLLLLQQLLLTSDCVTLVLLLQQPLEFVLDATAVVDILFVTTIEAALIELRMVLLSDNTAEVTLLLSFSPLLQQLSPNWSLLQRQLGSM
jgi:hypothetical protein